jgi:hypothetical protein
MNVLLVGAGHRLTIASDLIDPLRVGTAPPNLHLFPLIWSRDLELPASNALSAWALGDIDSRVKNLRGESMAEWPISPYDLLQNQFDPETADLAEMLFPCHVYRKGGTWRFTIPNEVRRMSCLPKRGESVVLKNEGNLLAIWSIEAWKAHVLSMTLPERTR